MKQPAAEKAKLPTTLVAALLCAFSVTQALAAIASKGGQREYPYKVVASTLLSETFKIVCSAFFLMRELSTLDSIDRKRALQCTAASVATAAPLLQLSLQRRGPRQADRISALTD